MKKLLSVILVVTLSLTLFTSCASVDKALASTYLNLGEKYLTDLDYEQAVVYFNKVIEVEPKNERAYLGAAEAYVALGDIDSAIAILEQGIEAVDDPTEIQAMLAELLGESETEEKDEVIADKVSTNEDTTPEETGEEEAEEEPVFVTTAKYYYDSDGSIRIWNEYEYDSNGILTKVIGYTPEGGFSGYNEYAQDSNGKLMSWINYDSDGEPYNARGEYEYDENGNMIKIISYDQSGNITSEMDFEYDEEGNVIRSTTWMLNNRLYVVNYNSSGELVSSILYNDDNITSKVQYVNEYDDDGKLIKTNGYDTDGHIVEYAEYEYTYDSNGKIVFKTITTYDDGVLYSIEYQSRIN